LLAGTGIRGQFEEKFKALLRDIEEEHGGVICFIDELRKFQVSDMTRQFRSLISHSDTLLNLGKAEGSVDAGQMIKPALARGLQLVGATTREHSDFIFFWESWLMSPPLQRTNTEKLLPRIRHSIAVSSR
jgi:ATP-dependent Clp protease ATP-binding subunit ClpB